MSTRVNDTGCSRSCRGRVDGPRGLTAAGARGAQPRGATTPDRPSFLSSSAAFCAASLLGYGPDAHTRDIAAGGLHHLGIGAHAALGDATLERFRLLRVGERGDLHDETIAAGFPFPRRIGGRLGAGLGGGFVSGLGCGLVSALAVRLARGLGTCCPLLAHALLRLRPPLCLGGTRLLRFGGRRLGLRRLAFGFGVSAFAAAASFASPACPLSGAAGFGSVATREENSVDWAGIWMLIS